MNFVHMLTVVLFFCLVYSWPNNNNNLNNGMDGNSNDFIELLDVSDTALSGATHGGSYLTIPGIAIFDCDGDGFEDIFYSSQENEYHKLFMNNGDFTFSEEGKERGINTRLGSYAAISFDFDNNGDIDLVLSYVGPFNEKGLQFYYNTGNCQFEDRTNDILGSQIPELWTGGGLSVSDYDHDGDLDLFVSAIGSVQGRTSPHSISGISTIYKNELNVETGFFQFIIVRSSPLIPTFLQWVCVSGFEDFDEDGWDDLVIGICGDPFANGDATYLWKNYFYENDSDDFEDVSNEYGLGICNDIGNGPQFPMSISYGHLDNDNHFDLFTTNAGNLGTTTSSLPTMYKSIWKNNQFIGYKTVDIKGLNNDQFAWGANFIDLDNDGKDDIITVGAFRPFITNKGYVYQNKVNKKEYLFKETQDLGLFNYSTSVVANADFDHDGFRDIVVNTMCTPENGINCIEKVPLKIYRNSGINDDVSNREYLDIGLKGNGIGTNYYGVGSLINVKIPCYKYEKNGKIRVGADGGNSNSIFAHFGIINRKRGIMPNVNSNNDIKAEICVNWMGREQTKECWQDIQLNQRIILTQSTGVAMY